MNDLDLRQIGKLIGLPLYVDVSSVKISEYRFKKAMLAGAILRRAMERSEPTDDEVEKFAKAHDLK